MNLPEAFVERMRQQLGSALPDFLRAMDQNPVRGIRLNPLKGCEYSKAYCSGPVPWEKNGYYLNADSQAGKTVLHEAGAFYLQEPSAMIPAAVLDAKPGEWILDLCAAPGGKSTQIGAAMKGDGLLVCNEPVPKRAAVLSRNIERMGITNAVTVSADPKTLSKRWAGLFDAVIADVPCSGEGMFRRDSEARTEWTADKAEGCVARQREILKEAAALVRPGGRLVYSTCTFHQEENEKNIQWFLSSFAEFETEPFELAGISAPEGMFTLYPHNAKGEGQFAALLRKKGNTVKRIISVQSLPAPTREEKKRLAENLPGLPEPTAKIRNTLIYLPSMPDLNGITVLRAGLHLAEIRGSTAVPEHALAVCSSPPQYNRMELDAENAVKYLAGETFATEYRGWTLMTYHGLVAGWGKGADGVMKNHYPKGLRQPYAIP